MTRERTEATVTDITAGRLQRVSKVIVYPLTVRITHWLNALAMFIMIMSGWRIYNSDPIFPFYFPVELTLGGSYDGSVDLHNEDGLAGAVELPVAAVGGFVEVPTFARLNPGYAGDDIRQNFRDNGLGFNR